MLTQRNLLEALKIREFYKCTHRLRNVAISLDEKDGDDIKKIEYWPIVRTYALDGR